VPSRDHRFGAVIGAGVLSVSLLSACGGADPTAQRQAEVAARGAQVMPFALDATTHRFTKTDTGGVQVVEADDPGDRTQVDLIRGHLRDERDKFARGDFEDPGRIHGHDMAGIAELRAGHAAVTVTYAEQPGGAQLIYTTEDRRLVAALHAWFDAQVSDHGAHAEAG
jgi:hypothetical protein